MVFFTLLFAQLLHGDIAPDDVKAAYVSLHHNSLICDDIHRKRWTMIQSLLMDPENSVL